MKNKKIIYSGADMMIMNENKQLGTPGCKKGQLFPCGQAQVLSLGRLNNGLLYACNRTSTNAPFDELLD